ncbi:MAG: hypothetical protein JWQ27_2995 [Ferruginibacter sp.]|nr:hypothetical protein [Ferruginibacter sp.]
MHTHEIHTLFAGGMAFEANVNDHIIRMDAGPDDGGHNSGASPKRLMLAALAGCTGIDIVSILDKMKVAFSDLRIDTTADLTDEHPKTYKTVKISYTIRLQEEDRPKMERAVKLSEEKYCGVMAMFRAFAAIETEIIYL